MKTNLKKIFLVLIIPIIVISIWFTYWFAGKPTAPGWNPPESIIYDKPYISNSDLYKSINSYDGEVDEFELIYYALNKYMKGFENENSVSAKFSFSQNEDFNILIEINEDNIHEYSFLIINN